LYFDGLANSFIHLTLSTSFVALPPPNYILEDTPKPPKLTKYITTIKTTPPHHHIYPATTPQH
jgi:hypothetical protein